MRVADSVNVKAVLPSSTSHCVHGQYTHRITFSPLSVTINLFQRYCLSQAEFEATGSNAASIWWYVIPAILPGGCIQSVFPGKAFANCEITFLSMYRFGLPMSASMEGNEHYRFDYDNSRSIAAGQRITGTYSSWINCHQQPNGFVMPIVISCTDATPGNLSLSPL